MTDKLILSGVITFALLVRWSVSMHNYSGYNTPPMYGDFEAQRHWQEITVNLPPSKWYKNSSENDLQYWGLDYPPLTAYHSWICGHIAKILDPRWVQLYQSRGLTEEHHKYFMRGTVLVADLTVYITGWIFLLSCATDRKISLLLVVLMYPGLTLIDYGHFQYNCVSLGLFVIALAAFCQRRDFLGTVFFCLALNYKQMELYHAIPFFVYLFGGSIRRGVSQCASKVIKLALSVISTFAICWLPFIESTEDTLHVVKRIFPVGRGLYEDKVANVWCSLSFLVKLRNIVPVSSLVPLCLFVTSVALAPSSVDLLLRPSPLRLKLAQVNASLAFFLFSFHVHEKSILLVAIPLLTLLTEERRLRNTHVVVITAWILLSTTASMFPLLVKDGLTVPYFATQISFLAMSYVYVCRDLALAVPRPLLACMLTSVLGHHVLLLLHLYVSPPARYPDLFPLAISIYSCMHFCAAYIYFNYVQIYGVTVKPDEESVKRHFD